MDGLFGRGDLGVFGLGRVVNLAAHGVLACLAQLRKNFIHYPTLEKSSARHAGTQDETENVTFRDYDHCLAVTVGVLNRCLANHFGFAFHQILRVNDLAAMGLDDIGCLFGVAENLAHVVGDEPHYTSTILLHGSNHEAFAVGAEYPRDKVHRFIG